MRNGPLAGLNHSNTLDRQEIKSNTQRRAVKFIDEEAKIFAYSLGGNCQ